MEKLYDRIIWHNGTTPAINETNLNKMSKALDDIDDRMIQIAGDVLVTVPQLQAMLEHTEDIMEQIEELSQNPPYIGANGNWYVWDTSTGAYTDSGVDASITVTIADVTALAPDAQPYVTNTGTSTDPVFHLFIPRGQKGDPGDVRPGSDLSDAEVDTITASTASKPVITAGDSVKVIAGKINKHLADLGSGKADKAVISDAWVSGQAYAVGDYCIYGDMIYRCVQTVTQGTAILPTNTSYWTPTKIAAEIKSLNSRLVNVITKTDTHYIYNNGSVDSTLWDNTFTATSGCNGTYSHTAGASNHLFSSGQKAGVWNIAEYVSSNIKVPAESSNYAIVEFDASFTDAGPSQGGSRCILQVTILTISDVELGKYNINENITGKQASFEVPNCKVIVPLNGNYYFKVKAFTQTGGESINKVKAYVKLKKIYTVRL